MEIGIIGAGRIGATLARLLVDVGQRVAISNTRGPASLAALVAELGPRAQTVSVAEAATFGEVVIEAIPFGRYRELPAALLVGKVVVTAANYYPQRDGLIELAGRAQSELVAEHLAGARIVKAFNTIWYQHLQTQGDPAKPIAARRVIPLSGDDPAAKQLVADLIAQLGFGPIDLGSLHDSTRQEPDSPIYNKDLTVAQARALLGG
ncbi:MAG: NAD(P)-binding domain-containing protein [Chloroflexales bacterium]|nr:NAD(P)-binding domain-containing protein [Chloroflexales bacterium]